MISLEAGFAGRRVESVERLVLLQRTTSRTLFDLLSSRSFRPMRVHEVNTQIRSEFIAGYLSRSAEVIHRTAEVDAQES